MLKPVRLAFITAIGLGLFSLLGIASGPSSLIGTSIFLAAAIGLWRGVMWCGFGPALVLAAWVLGLLVIGASNTESFTALRGELIMGALIYVLAAWIFYRAGRALLAAGSPRTLAAPWLALSGLTVALSCVLLFLKPFVIPTGAMEDTLLIGDHLLVPRLGAVPVSRGDIVVFRYPINPRQIFVKRVIGVPGDHIRIDRKQVFRNGVTLSEPHKRLKTEYLDPYRDTFPSEPNVNLYPPAVKMLEKHVTNGAVVVPPNSYFVMGDNRDTSLDSRYWGFVPRENIIGKPWIVYWSMEAHTDNTKPQPSGWSFSLIRWNRIFTQVR